MQTEDAQTKSPFPSHFALDKMWEDGTSLNLLRKVKPPDRLCILTNLQIPHTISAEVLL